MIVTQIKEIKIDCDNEAEFDKIRTIIYAIKDLYPNMDYKFEEPWIIIVWRC